jgi:hypothetical protein
MFSITYTQVHENKRARREGLIQGSNILGPNQRQFASCANDTAMRSIFDPGGDTWSPSIEYVYMKARRADFHLQSAEQQLRDWVKSNPYTITEKDNSDRTLHVFIISPQASNEEIALTIGDFVNCLRACLDQLAWNLVNLFPSTIPTDDKTATKVVFPICRTDTAYREKRALFDPIIHPVLDSLQPSDRANATQTEPLWQLDKLWNLDKHRTIPVNCGNWTIKFRGDMKGFIEMDSFNQCFVAAVPCLSRFYLRPSYVQPQITPDILFGEYMGTFAVDIKRLREIYKVVTENVIPRFAGFFP